MYSTKSLYCLPWRGNVLVRNRMHLRWYRGVAQPSSLGWDVCHGSSSTNGGPGGPALGYRDAVAPSTRPRGDSGGRGGLADEQSSTNDLIQPPAP